MASYRFVLRTVILGIFMLFTALTFTAYKLLQELHLANHRLMKHGYVEESDDLDLRKVTSAFAKDDSYDDINEKDFERIKSHLNDPSIKPIPYPILMWWYGFSRVKGQVKQCGSVQCFITNNRTYFNHPSMKVFLMHGTSFDYMDLPFPRQPHHEWGLQHDESPSNVFLLSHPEIMELYNHTSTFKRESDFPLSTVWLKYLKDLESTEYLVPVEEKTRMLSELALVNYVHSNCGAYSDRDHFYDMMSQHIKVDSYGRCKHNKDLPDSVTHNLKGMDKPDFYKIVAQYKFTLTTENAICDDYQTEKLWRPLIVGSVPIIIGSPRVRDFLPDDHSAIIVSDFKNMKDLVDLLLHLNSSDDEYNKYLQFKRPGGVTNTFLRKHMEERQYGRNVPGKPTMKEGFECGVCKRLHENMEREKSDLLPIKHQASVEHYGCPKPNKFKGEPPNDLERVDSKRWGTEWVRSSFEAKALKEYWNAGIFNYTEDQIIIRMSELYLEYDQAS